MRNVFDQYNQPENRLTHALAVCLDEDRRLLSDFLAMVGANPPERNRRLVVVEQSLPGDVLESEDDAERKGLPDIVINDGDRWCLLIESKVEAALTEDQLKRHERTLKRRGFDRIYRLALTKSGVRIPTRTIGISWPDLYEWLGLAGQRREWPERLRSYLRAAELRLAREEYLTEGTLTVFDGFPFSADNPYTYGEAKRLLKLALAELKRDRTLRSLGVDPNGDGRGAITGRSGRLVWDFLSLSERPRSGAFTAYPHLTLALHADHLEVAVTIPNGVIRPVRRRLAELRVDGFVDMNRRVLRRAKPLISRGAWVEATAVQRHYLGQRSPATTDAAIIFRLETSQPKGTGRVKPQREWAELFASLPARRRSNIQFQYRVHMPWTTRGLDTRESLKIIVAGWMALKPLLDTLRSD